MNMDTESCPSCSAPLKPETIGNQRGFVCSTCTLGYIHQPQAEKGTYRLSTTSSELATPHGFITSNEGDTLVLTYTQSRQNRRQTIISTIVIHALALGCAVPFFLSVLPGWNILWCLIPLVLGLLLFNVLTVVYLVNKVYYSINHQSIQIHQKPIPWWGNPNVQSANVEGVYAQGTRTSAEENQELPGSYAVYVCLRDGNEPAIEKNITAREAVFLAQQIARKLGLHASEDGSIYTRTKPAEA